MDATTVLMEKKNLITSRALPAHKERSGSIIPLNRANTAPTPTRYQIPTNVNAKSVLMEKSAVTMSRAIPAQSESLGPRIPINRVHIAPTPTRYQIMTTKVNATTVPRVRNEAMTMPRALSANKVDTVTAFLSAKSVSQAKFHRQTPHIASIIARPVQF
jgi:hypothetical protein